MRKMNFPMKPQFSRDSTAYFAAISDSLLDIHGTHWTLEWVNIAKQGVVIVLVPDGMAGQDFFSAAQVSSGKQSCFGRRSA